MPLPVALQSRLAKRGLLKHVEPGGDHCRGLRRRPRGLRGLAARGADPALVQSHRPHLRAALLLERGDRPGVLVVPQRPQLRHHQTRQEAQGGRRAGGAPREGPREGGGAAGAPLPPARGAGALPQQGQERQPQGRGVGPHGPQRLLGRAAGDVVHGAAQEERGQDRGGHDGGGAAVPAAAVPQPGRRAARQRRGLPRQGLTPAPKTGPWNPGTDPRPENTPHRASGGLWTPPQTPGRGVVALLEHPPNIQGGGWPQNLPGSPTPPKFQGVPKTSWTLPLPHQDPPNLQGGPQNSPGPPQDPPKPQGVPPRPPPTLRGSPQRALPPRTPPTLRTPFQSSPQNLGIPQIPPRTLPKCPQTPQTSPSPQNLPPNLPPNCNKATEAPRDWN